MPSLWVALRSGCLVCIDPGTVVVCVSARRAKRAFFTSERSYRVVADRCISLNTFPSWVPEAPWPGTQTVWFVAFGPGATAVSSLSEYDHDPSFLLLLSLLRSSHPSSPFLSLPFPSPPPSHPFAFFSSSSFFSFLHPSSLFLFALLFLLFFLSINVIHYEIFYFIF